MGGGVGYLFRSDEDARGHGVVGDVAVDTGSLGPFALRLEGMAVSVGGSAAAPSPLSFFGGAASALYRLDDTAVLALAGIGPLIGTTTGTTIGTSGATADGDGTTLTAGLLASLTLRFALTSAVSVEARLFAPIVFYDGGWVAPLDGLTNRWPLQAGAVVGLVFLLDALWAQAGEGRGPQDLLQDTLAPAGHPKNP